MEEASNVMIDLETLGTSSGCVVLTIGLVSFDTDGVKESLCIAVDIEDSLKLGMTVSGRTIKWWLGQSEEARESLFKGNAVPVDIACKTVVNFFKEACGKNVKVWGNGAAFDQPILRHLFDVSEVRVPWKYGNEMCYRTLLALNCDTHKSRPDIAHDCVSDATAQAKTLISMAKSYESVREMLS